MDARELLRTDRGTIYTVTGRSNRVLSIGDRDVIVGTERSPNGEAVPVEWVQDALDQLRLLGNCIRCIRTCLMNRCPN